MKEIRNLAIKNYCFGELEYEDLSSEQKKKALLLLILMVMKRDGQIKSRGVANGENGESTRIRIQLLHQRHVFVH